MLLREVGVARFDDTQLKWRTHDVRQSKKTGNTNVEWFTNEAVLSGAHSFQPGRNIFWRAAENVVELIELSLEHDIKDKALRVVLETTVCSVVLHTHHLLITTVTGQAYVFILNPSTQDNTTSLVIKKTLQHSTPLDSVTCSDCVVLNQVAYCSFGLNTGSVVLCCIGLKDNAVSETTLQDSSLASRLWSGAVSEPVVAVHLLPQGPFCVVVYGDCKLRVWNVVDECCVSSHSIPVEKSGAIKRGWIKQLSTDPFKLLVVLCVSNVPDCIVLNGVLKGETLSIKSALALDVGITKEQVRGATLCSVCVDDKMQVFTLWRNLSRPSDAMIIQVPTSDDQQQITTQHNRLIIPSMDRALLQRDDKYNTKQNMSVDQYFLHRLCMPNRYTYNDVALGVVLCSGVEGEEYLTKLIGDNTIEWSHVLEAAKWLCKGRCEVWEQLLQDCEQAWLQKQSPRAICCIGDTTTLVRSSTICLIRPTSSLENTLFTTQKPSDLLQTAVSLAATTEFPLSSSPTAYLTACVAAAHQLPEESVRAVKRVSAVTPPNELHEVVESLLDGLFKQYNGDKENSQLFTNGVCVTVQQQLKVMLSVVHGLSLFLSILSVGIISGPNSATVFSEHWSHLKSTPSLKHKLRSLMHRLSHLFHFLKTLNTLGELPFLAPQQYNEWVFHLSAPLYGRKPIRTKSSSNVLHCIEQKVFARRHHEAVASSPKSVLELWIQHCLRRDDYSFTNAADHVLYYSKHNFDKLLRFLHNEQQYQLLLDVLLRHREFLSTPERELELLIAESRVWHVVQLNDGNNGNREQMLVEACRGFEANAPTEDAIFYYMTVMKLFERAGQPRLSVRFALYALAQPECDEERKGVLCSNIFARTLEPPADYNRALEIAIQHPEVSERHKCVRQLVYALVDRAEIQSLCLLPFQTHGEEVWKVVIQALESKIDRANVGVDSSQQLTYFHVMYTFCVNHGRFTTAACVMYDLAHHVEVAVLDGSLQWTANVLKRYAGALSAVLTTLRLVKPEHAVIIRPYKTLHTTSNTLNLKQVQDKFALARVGELLCGNGRLKELNGVYLVELCIEQDRVDEAIGLCDRFELDASMLMEYLVDCSVRDNNWIRLKRALTTLKYPLQNYKYYIVVLKRLLLSDIELPQWLIDSLATEDMRAFGKNGSPSELIRMLLSHDRVQEASVMLLVLLKSMMVQELYDHSAMTNPPFLPFKLIDQVLILCKDDELKQKIEAIVLKLGAEFQRMANTTVGVQHFR